ncbi:conserved hypothetical protein [Gluconacetobacter diazotrophicus PA1 5]|uniref:Uncharacterized protein n=1 Tax=Gluconacetobacter diazotrophicus (strain ATCC 49037 / DSM 5601 / CCUG 37298 / CIP 103539 / LMG 7603 / PAl5) TaxID=272568 RepID=A9HRC2_GLUDA|nr:hypothetical protein [Gluconacetobacter diazotrophicus]ACI53146.1 conserved hypothetical protein [Gluconacetobacter diazotrophicus PA1 5]TWB05578.1 hypothetical protein FBZ86_1155 [Gluconacetobacter diazotrophicus]CAP56872.1 conserved hypothetical protein [Gluconacetobacter diazotrophicus PA1 5]
MDHPHFDSPAAGQVARLLIGELIQPVAPDVTAFVSRLVGDAPVLGVLFYGSGLRQADPDGILDFYVVLDRQSDWPRGGAALAANTLLPPNVEYHEWTEQGRCIRAKVAILTLSQFRALTGRATLDTTMWARFCQPVRLVWARDDQAADRILRCLVRAVGVAAWWAACLGPEQGTAAIYWQQLFAHTYEAELRVESAGRAQVLLAGQQDRYRDLLIAAWTASGLPFTQTGDVLHPLLSAATRARARRQWQVRAGMGRPLNIARLAKAAFTFAGGAGYIAWKIRRHSGFDLKIPPFAARHPLLCLPWLLWKLRQAGIFTRR